MHPPHDYVAKQLTGKIKSRRVVVWYDERGEFRPFVDEMCGGARSRSDPMPVAVGDANAHLAECAGSMFELRGRRAARQRRRAVCRGRLHSGAGRDRRASVLMELEKAGTTWEPQLAKNVLFRAADGVAGERRKRQSS